jgi:ABC-type transporter Mla subunit MlaD
MGVEFIQSKLGEAQLTLVNEAEPALEALLPARQQLEETLPRVVSLLDELSSVLDSCVEPWEKLVTSLATLAISAKRAQELVAEAEARASNENAPLQDIGLLLQNVQGTSEGLSERFPPDEPNIPRTYAERIRVMMGVCKGDQELIGERRHFLTISSQTETAVDKIMDYIEGLDG